MKEITLIVAWIDVENRKVYIAPINRGAERDLVLEEGDRIVVGLDVEMFTKITSRVEKSPT